MKIPIMILRILGLFVVLSHIMVLNAQNATTMGHPSSILAGAAHADITPGVKVKNWVTGKPYEFIHDSIYVRALVLSDNMEKVVILHWEIVDAGESATDLVREKIAAALNIPENNILVNAAHNHSAPWAPVYGDDNRRGKERDPWWATRYMPEQNGDPHFQEWMKQLIQQSVLAAEEANSRLQPVTIWLGRYDASRYIRNRRPRPVSSGIMESGLPQGFGYKHPDWDPNVLSGDRTFGPLDRTLSVLSFRNSDGENVSTIFHMSCHAVSIYPFMDGVSGDWSGEVTRVLNRKIGGENLFLQGTAGDVNPWRRGEEAVQEMAEGLTESIKIAYNYSARLIEGPIKVNYSVVGLPLTDYGTKRTGLKALNAEIQAITIGSLAMVTLPGEPMTGLGMGIRAGSPFPQTIVLGYSNGNGGHYCGMPGEKAHGGYESGEKVNLGTDRAGLLMVETAIDLLHKMKVE